MTTVYRSDPARVALHRSGWIEVAPNRWVARRPPVDRDRDDYPARLGAGPAEAWCVSRGLRLATVAELQALHPLSVFISPVTLPTAEMLAADAGKPVPDGPGPRPWQLPPDGRDSPGMSAYRAAHMMTREWCDIADAEIARRLLAAGYTGTQPAVNDGKHWAKGARGRCIYGGFKRPAPSLDVIQNESYAHAVEPEFDDYMTTFFAAYDGDNPPAPEDDPHPVSTSSPGDDVADTDPAPALAPFVELGEAVASAIEHAGQGFEAFFAPDRHEPTPLPAAYVSPPSLPGDELLAVRTPVAAQDLRDALARLLPGLGEVGLELLVAQSAHETDGWRSCWNFSLGNEKAFANWPGAFCYRYCDEGLTQAEAARAIAEARPRADGSGALDARIKGQRKDGKVVVEFWPSSPYARFRAFLSLDEAARAWLAVLRLPRYAAAWAALWRGDLLGFVTGLAQGGYFTATAQSYAVGLQWRLGIVRAALAVA